MLDHLSYSSISLYLSCPAAWKFRYIDKVATPSSPALVFGSAWHDTIETYVAGKAVNGNGGSLLSLWDASWAQQMEKNPNVDWGLDGPEAIYNDGVRMLQTPEITGLLDSLRPKRRHAEGCEIEKKVQLMVPGVPIPLIGYIDIITEDAIPGDFKTASRSWSNDKALGELQPLFYLAALNQAGIQTPGWRFRHYIFVKTKVPKAQVIEHSHNIGQLMFLFQMIRNVWISIERDAFNENPTGWQCSPQYCDYWKLCRGRYE